MLSSALEYAKHLYTLLHSSPQGSDESGAIAAPTLPMKKLKLREGRQLAPGHIARCWHSLDLNPSSLTAQPTL